MCTYIKKSSICCTSKAKVLDKNEILFNYKRTIEFHGIDEGYQRFRIITEYELKNSSRNQLLFVCNFFSDIPKGLEVVYEKEYEVSWMFGSKQGDLSLSKDAFILESVYINDIPIKNIQTKESTGQKIEYKVDPHIELDGKKIRYIFKVKQSAEYAFITTPITRLTRNYDITFDYKMIRV